MAASDPAGIDRRLAPIAPARIPVARSPLDVAPASVHRKSRQPASRRGRELTPVEAPTAGKGVAAPPGNLAKIWHKPAPGEGRSIPRGPAGWSTIRTARLYPLSHRLRPCGRYFGASQPNGEERFIFFLSAPCTARSRTAGCRNTLSSALALLPRAAVAARRWPRKSCRPHRLPATARGSWLDVLYCSIKRLSPPIRPLARFVYALLVVYRSTDFFRLKAGSPCSIKSKQYQICPL